MDIYGPSETVRVWFNSYDSSGAPVAPSAAFTTADFAIYSSGSATQKANTTGLTMTSPFDAQVGLHLLEIDLSTDTDLGVNEIHTVTLETAKTVDSQSVDGVVLSRFGIQSSPVVRGTFSGTHTTTTSDLGANAPANDISGYMLVNHTDEETVVITSYATGTGVATHAAWDNGAGVTDGEEWSLIPGPAESAKLALSMRGVIAGTASGTPTTVSNNSDLAGFADDELIGRTIVFTSGTAQGQAAEITDYANTSGVVTYAAITTASVSGDTFIIV